jgi:hypothetical protein
MIDRISPPSNTTSIPINRSANSIAQPKVVPSSCSTSSSLSAPCSLVSKIQSYLANAGACVALFFKELWSKWIGLFTRGQNASSIAAATTRTPSPAPDMPRSNTPLSRISPSTLPYNHLVPSHTHSTPQPNPSSPSQMMPVTHPTTPPPSSTRPAHPDSPPLQPSTLNSLPQPSTLSIPSRPPPPLMQPSPPLPEPPLTLAVQAPYEKTATSPSSFPLLPYPLETFCHLHPILQIYELLQYAEKTRLNLHPPQSLLDPHTGKLQVMPLKNENPEAPCNHVIDRAILIECMKEGPQSLQIQTMLKQAFPLPPIQIDCPCCLNERRAARVEIGKWKICTTSPFVLEERPQERAMLFFREVTLDNEKIKATSKWLRETFYSSQEFCSPKEGLIVRQNRNILSLKKFFPNGSCHNTKNQLNYLIRYAHTSGIQLLPPPHLTDPISGKIFREPVPLGCGHFIDFGSLRKWVTAHSMISNPDVWKCPHRNCSCDIPLSLINSEMLPENGIDPNALKSVTDWLMNTLYKSDAIKKDETCSTPSEDELRPPPDPFDVNNPFYSCTVEDHTVFASPIDIVPGAEVNLDEQFQRGREAYIETHFTPTSPVVLQTSPSFTTLGNRIKTTEREICNLIRTFIEKQIPSFTDGQNISDLDELIAKLKRIHPLRPANSSHSNAVSQLMQALTLFKSQEKFYDTSTWDPLYHPLSEHRKNPGAAPHVFAQSTIERLLSQNNSNCPRCRNPWDLKIGRQNGSSTAHKIPKEVFNKLFAEDLGLQEEFFKAILEFRNTIQTILKD